MISSHSDEEEDRRPNSEDFTGDRISNRRREEDSDDDEEVASDSPDEDLDEGWRDALGDSVLDYGGVIWFFVENPRGLSRGQSDQYSRE